MVLRARGMDRLIHGARRWRRGPQTAWLLLHLEVRSTSRRQRSVEERLMDRFRCQHAGKMMQKRGTVHDTVEWGNNCRSKRGGVQCTKGRPPRGTQMLSPGIKGTVECSEARVDVFF